MAETRDPESDQPLPEPGGFPVQAVLIEALKQRMAFGLKKYGRPLETDNGRDPLRDMWEEMLDMVSYFTQYVLEQGTVLPGLEQFTRNPEPGRALSEGSGPAAGALAGAIPEICPMCRHEPHAPGRCRSQALNLGCGCLCE
jgi:hypothetical protein